MLSKQHASKYFPNLDLEDPNFFNMTVKLHLETSSKEAKNQNTKPAVLTSQNDLKVLEAGFIPKNTIKKREWAIKKFNAWRTERNTRADSTEKISAKNIESFSVEELVFCLSCFVLEAKDVKMNQYRPKTMLELVLNIQQYINTKIEHDVYKFLTDVRFKKLKGVIDSVFSKQCQRGENAPRKAADIITPEMEDILWSKKLLGSETPQLLLTTLLFYTGLNFALRGGTEHTNLILKNFTENQDGSVTYNEFQSKNNTPGLKAINKESKSVTCFPNLENQERSLPHLLKIYKSHRPVNITESKFYLRPLPKPKSDIWYSIQCVGIHKIETMVKDLMQKAEIDGYFTMHSLRASAATRLYSNNIEEQKISEITGHRSSAIRAYKRTSNSQKMEVSKIIQNCQSSSHLMCEQSFINVDSTMTFTSEKKKMKIQADGNTNTVQITFE